MKSVLGGIMLAVGILLMTGSGLCTATVIVMGLSGSSSPGEMLPLLPFPLIIGGVPFALGFGLFFSGRALVREAKRDTLEADVADRFK